MGSPLLAEITTFGQNGDFDENFILGNSHVDGKCFGFMGLHCRARVVVFWRYKVWVAPVPVVNKKGGGGGGVVEGYS